MNTLYHPTEDPASLGYHFHVRLNDVSLDDLDRQVLEALQPIGVQITNHNFCQEEPYEVWMEKLTQLLHQVKQRTGREHMLFSIDHEGGRVHRTPPPLTHFPAAQYCSDSAAEVGRAMAIELRSLGLNLSFSPCADIHSNPDNPVIGTRSFGTTEEIVTRAARAFSKALLDEGILSCAKHFPGHGDTSLDTHLALPTVSITEETFRQRELVPFQKLADDNIPMIMTAHIIFPALDSKLPATLSRRIVKQILRDEFAYSGAIMTDDLDMQAIRDHYDEADIARYCIPAGCDLLLFNHEPLRALDVARGIYRNLEAGIISEELLKDSAERISNLLDQASPGGTPKLLDSETLIAHAELAKRLHQKIKAAGGDSEQS